MQRRDWRPSAHRRFRARRAVAACLSIALLAGCASSNLYKGRQALRNGDSTRALQLLRAARLENPTNPVLLRELGVAAYKQTEYDSAMTALVAATAKRQRDARAFFYLGATHEAKKDYRRALEAYGRYAVVRGDDGERREMEKRLSALQLRQLQLDYRSAFAAESTIACTSDPSAIAVFPFDAMNLSPMYAKVGRGVAVLVMNDLTKIRSLRVVDRLRLNVLLKEMQLAAGAAPSTVTAGQGTSPDPGARNREDTAASANPPATSMPRDQAGAPTTSASNWGPITTVVGVKQRLAAMPRPSNDPTRAGRPYYAGPIDARVDSSYVNAVSAFQADQGLDADGVVGPLTRRALQAAARTAGVTPTPATPPPVTPAVQAAAPTSASPPRWTARVEPSTAPRLGNILCARTLVTGSVLPLANDNLRIDALPASVYGETYEPGAAQVSGMMTRLFEIEKRLVLDIVETKMRITLTEDERRAILGTRPPQNFLAFLAFCNGLELEAEGRYREAALEFRRAVAIDPGFEAAREAAQMDEDLAEADLLSDPEKLFAPPPDVEELGARLETSLNQVNTSHASTESEDTEVRTPIIGEPPTPPRDN